MDNLRNDLNCSICLDVFSSPLSLPCGHSFCQQCIHEHLDRQEAAAAAAAAPAPDAATYSCPDCRFPFSERPEPQKNVSLSKVVDDVRALDISGALVPQVREEGGPVAGAAPPRCPRHRQELSLYCATDCRCICCKCLLTGCRSHELLEIGELSLQRKEELSHDLLATDRQQKQIKEDMETWRSEIDNMKDSHEKMLFAVMGKFEQVRKTLEECQILVVQSVTCEKEAALAQAEEHLVSLQRHLTDLEEHRREAETLLARDQVTFLEGLPQLVQVGAAPKSPKVQISGNLQMGAVAKILPKVTRLLQQELPNLLHPEKRIDGAREPSGTPSRSDSSRTPLSEQIAPPHRSPARISDHRAQLYKDYRNLKFDPETANKHLELSHDNCRATHKSRFRRSDVPDSARRFGTWQVLCTEGFSEGSHYWEVGVSTFFVDLGVAYESLKRTNEPECNIGRNSSSWSLQLRSIHQSAWHNNQETKLQSPMFRKIGVHLDMTAGSLAFYGVKDGGLHLLYSFPCLFSEKVFPAFWIGEDTSVSIRTIPKETIDQGLCNQLL
ncbi:E3 ubiquitin-protein ligase TRIM65-like [Dendropsophus ebraccatus]|uniref:E3 ubiquitin-protein ligase TRIM65-like n=1 Tax=Dendropsophus ebraccatus TaxID=150705 RepID=UPI0038322550